MEASPKMQEYFAKMDATVLKAYEIANAAKAKGFDPDQKVEIPLAKNMAERVEGLISSVAPEIVGKGVVGRIADLEKKYGSQDWRVAMTVAEEVASEKFCKFETKIKAIETGIRVGFAYATVGVVSSPLEGFAGLQLKKRNDDGKEYFSLLYSGPVRSAGGTGAAVSVLIADYIRKKLGYAAYDPTEEEVKRACTEIEDYHDRVTNLQYFPSKDEVAFMSKNLPLQVDGDGTAEIEVSNYKGLPRIESNRIRGGFCLVIAECLCAKAKKLNKQLGKWGKDMGLEQWGFLTQFLEIQDKMKAKGAKKDNALISPDYTYIKDIVAGRPVISYPLRNGGLRLRYGRARDSGLSSDAISPATMVILNSYIAIGTQFKTERPGKSTTLSACDCIDGPIVKLKNGSVRRVETFEDAKKYFKEVAEIIYVGDILCSYGDFLNRNHKLVPAGFVEEWWGCCLEKHMTDNNLPIDAVAGKSGIGKEKIEAMLKTPMWAKAGFEEAIKLSNIFQIPLHPRWIYYWNSVTPENFYKLYDALKKAVIEPGKIIIANMDQDAKRALELIGLQHTLVSNEYVVIEGEDAQALLANLGNLNTRPEQKNSTLEMINSISPILIKDKCGTFIGARMGRPEKAKARELKGSPQVLFPIGKEGGRLRSFQSALEKGYVDAQLPNYFCSKCNKNTIFAVCEDCGQRAKKLYFCKACNKDLEEKECPAHGKCLPFKSQRIDIKHYYETAVKDSGVKGLELVKGIRGTSNEEHIPEHIMKGIFRAKHGIHVNKDGTVRYDMTEMSCTHFKPKEAGVSVAKLKEIGYEKDCYGKELESDEQILELKIQDVILPSCDSALDDGADTVLLKVANFIDDTLERLYGLKRYYNAEKKSELIGQLCVAMSPHTAAGIVCRIVGFSKTQGFLAHPLLHCIMRRDCLAYETRLPIYDGKGWNFVKIGEFVENLNPSKFVDFYGTKAIKVKGFKTLGLNPSTGLLEEVEIRDFTKHATRAILKISMEDGRSIRVTQDHKFCIKLRDSLMEKQAKDLSLGDELMVPVNIHICEQDIESINLFDIFNGREDIVVRGITAEVMRVIDLLGGRAETRKRIRVSKSTLDNYLLRNSYPLYFLQRLSDVAGKLPMKNAKIAAKYDTVLLNPIIQLNSDVLWLIGLYVAEGCARKKTGKKGLFQIDFAASENEIRKKIVSACAGNFGLRPSCITGARLTFSSRILYELFIDVLDCGVRAREKKVPPLFFSLPKERLRHFLSGYFDGDGSVSITDARVTCDSVSEELLSGIAACLSRYNIYTKWHTYKHKPGPKVREFYHRKGRKIPYFEITRLLVPSTYISNFYHKIGFWVKRKQDVLKAVVKTTKPYGMKIRHDESFAYPRIVSIKADGSEETYCLNVKGHIISPEGIITKQCDGDEAAVMLLMDHLLNFSKKFLPNKRGATQDAPLVLTSKLIPSEVDDMIFDMDTAWKYPLELYEAAEQYKPAGEVKVEVFRSRLGTEGQYEGMGFTHDISDLNKGVRCSAYKSVPSMGEKVMGQMDIAMKARAVDEDDVARLVIERHFIRDIKGNLRKFSTQQFRCVSCNEKFRRPPLKGKCTKCDGKILFTISEGSVIKYMAPVEELVSKYRLSPYLRQSIELTKMRIESVFGKAAERQEALKKWLG